MINQKNIYLKPFFSAKLKIHQRYSSVAKKSNNKICRGAYQIQYMITLFSVYKDAGIPPTVRIRRSPYSQLFIGTIQ